MLDYKLVEAVAAVLQYGGFEKAALHLNITQSAISQRVRLLEERMSCPLLIRSTPPSATEAGLRLLQHYQQVHTLELSLVDELTPDAGSLFKTLSIGVNSDSLATWLLSSVEALCLQQQLLLDVQCEDEQISLDMLRQGGVIGCISSSPEAIQGCRVEALGRMSYITVATPEYIQRHFPDGVDAKSLRSAPTVTFSIHDRLQDRYLQQYFSLPPGDYPSHQLPSTQAFLDAALLGMAYSLVPRIQAAEPLQKGLLKELAPGYEVHSDLYWHYWNIRSPLLEQFSQALLQQAAKQLVPIDTAP
ncbi:LysR family transcriptional regulator ArgP [Aestuariirhabdus sp. Z084]|uniref:LysR family transcriptional regulator ArgP n=1 Tax=Aestuariirhabdus haliotis TaxID=2918751 RepID=UPI00201B3CB6|nr:LysR family transcriptional regulator ArgP [Aestuariirhabdus haliotis]MCL6417449.1 LysR family transcriptional regulator ArgP [Aestuariirhabdus haliotis]MCL6421399.1 LysR family transcriptional regulator ArgP [Aestuariirhabdus haliotis]